MKLQTLLQPLRFVSFPQSELVSQLFMIYNMTSHFFHEHFRFQAFLVRVLFVFTHSSFDVFYSRQFTRKSLFALSRLNFSTHCRLVSILISVYNSKNSWKKSLRGKMNNCKQLQSLINLEDVEKSEREKENINEKEKKLFTFTKIHFRQTLRNCLNE